MSLITKFNDLGIGPRLVGGFLLLALACAVQGYSELQITSTIHQSQKNANSKLIPSIYALTDARGKGINMIQRTDRTLIMATRSKNEPQRLEAQATLDRAWAALRDAMAWYESLPMDEREKKLWAEYLAGLGEFRRHHEEMMRALKAGDLEGAEKLCLDPALGLKMNDRLNTLIDVQQDIAKQQTIQAQDQYNSARTTMLGIVGATVILSLVLAVYFRNQIARPLASSVKVLQAVAAGDLGHRVVASGRNEFGQMATALNTAIETMQANVTEMARLGALVEQSPLNVMFADREFKIRYANQATVRTLRGLEKYLPIKADALVGQSIDIFHKRPEHQRRLLSNPDTVPPATLIPVGPETLELRVSPVFDTKRNHLGTMVSWAVVTDRIAMEKQVKENAEREHALAIDLQQKMTTIVTSVSAMANGDFTQQVPDLGTDEVGQMAAALNKAIISVRTALEGVHEVSEQLADASGQLSAASDEISTGAQEQASSLEETASTLEEITATVRQNSDSAQQARQLASTSRDTAEKGGQVVGNAVEAMSEINESSKKIADIITTIDEIAFQTNLLALNAAVEAARAGEQGRGFAVVASEVRNLAQRSATAAKEIKSLIEDSVKKVDAGTELVNRSGSTLGDIVTSVKRVTDIITEIAAASKEQSTGIDQVNKAVSQMDTVTQKNASQTEEMSATAQTLTDQASQLRDLVARFKLSESGRGAPRPAPRSKAPATKPRPAVAKALKNGHSNGHGRGRELDRLGNDDHGGFTEF
ncbi:chemotaxis protein : Methyl-accepting chemotaxis (MCP) signaling domain protein OS=Vibrio cholerae CP1047(20) GN=VCCP1047_2988 PE=4 SV=1: 4HB_MCP_1: HAMP: HAMP: MCPsignal [Gemmata massiliana]|uniref:Methyl-accepting chemotaxis protein n=1 Tax=Gemmata massiliana TaxID=1210884 RepID=A0A6P2D139_9BACT|nr:methyl-accepting chemotaxis protein [Gemmata massiliana]VTR93170.1 chemotaxis protein : Methyl-accepting chemotaxis (MCP) signaling domain protein OS=Vibrio cholerae CP1047(20) GN=VCCP1047_2988 PE=4 SV=1: 4HB_MCP_1: HAMP: HAMP: MCPsignal [Gemmata massiliana]